MNRTKFYAFVLATVLAVFVGLAGVGAQEGWGQVAFQNNTVTTGDLYVDGNYGCRAFGNGGFCTTQVRVGIHTLSARFSDGVTVSRPNTEVEQGRVFTWTIRDE